MKRIFLDIDGVLADFVKGAKRLLRDASPYESTPWDFIPADAWNRFDAMFWESLDALPDAERIVELCQRLGETYLLTSLPKTYRIEAQTGKQRWVERFFPHLRTRTIFAVNGKAGWAWERALLVDDHTENVTAFLQAGGSAAIVGRPWNYVGEDEPYEVLEGRVKQLVSLMETKN